MKNNTAHETLPVEGFWPVASGSLYYRVLSRGPKLLLCFHGYGLDAASFSPLASTSEGKYTMVSFDHFFHGKSVWPQRELAIPVDQLCDALLEFAHAHGFEKINLLAFSLGGKVALSLVHRNPEKVERLYLIAPDGIKTSFWYSLATYPVFFRNLLKRIVLKPWFFYMLVKTLRTMHLVDKGILRFANAQMDTVKKRYRLYHTWVCYKELKPQTTELIQVLKNTDIDIWLYLGVYDKIITRENLYLFTSQLPKLKLSMLYVGHNRLIDALSKTGLGEATSDLDQA